MIRIIFMRCEPQFPERGHQSILIESSLNLRDAVAAVQRTTMPKEWKDDVKDTELVTCSIYNNNNLFFNRYLHLPNKKVTLP